MSNFYVDTPTLGSILDSLDLEGVVRMLERGYSEAAEFDFAPSDFDDAMTGYHAALEMVGEIAAGVVAEHAHANDQEGAHLIDGVAVYPKGTLIAYRRLAEAGFVGSLVPRRFGGLNFPSTVYTMMIEMVSRGDGALMTLFGYQDVAEALAHFGPEDVAAEMLPAYCAGDLFGSMVLTEAGGGSDLAATRTRARQDEHGDWYLNGTKQFISNGNGGLLLVLARSEPGSSGMFGLSLFVSDGTGVEVTRLEEKMGLHASPTCELVFTDAPARLVGRRRMGLPHTMYTLNQARFSVASQALGIADAAYRSARLYAGERKAFGQRVEDFPAVASMLADMETGLEAQRILLYDACTRLDLRNRLEVEIDRQRAAGVDASSSKARFANVASEVDFLSPAVKAMCTETALGICIDAQQIFGGMGYIRETGIERLVRDVRVTTVYEGTTQVQYSSAVGPAASDVLASAARAVRAERGGASPPLLDELASVSDEVLAMLRKLDPDRREAAAQKAVDVYLGWWTSHLWVFRHGGAASPLFRRWTVRWIAEARSVVELARLGWFG